MAWTNDTELTPSDSEYTKTENKAFDKFEGQSWSAPKANGNRNPEQYELETVVVEDLNIRPQDFNLSPGETNRTSTVEGDIQRGTFSWTVQDPPSDD